MNDATMGTGTPPGPTGFDVARWYKRLTENTFRAFIELARDYGDFVRFPFTPTRDIFICSHPDDVQHVLQDNHRNYQKAVTYEYMKPVVGEGLLTADGEHWLSQRRLVAPMFHRQRIRTFAETMIDTTAEMLDDWENLGADESVDIAADMSQLTLSIAGTLLFNRDIGRESDRIGEHMMLLFRDVNRRITSPLSIPRQVPTPHNRRVQNAIRELEEIVFDMIDERRGEEEDYEDLLSMFMLAEDEQTGERMDDRQIRDELMTFMIAGHDTTSNLLTWTFYLLSTHPDVRRRLVDEIDEHVDSRLPDLQTVRELDFLENVIDESLRLYPPAWTIEREPVEDDEIRGYQVPAGSIVVAGPYFVHHNPNVWSNPEGFDPDRFAADADRPDHRYAHFPFGGGPRMCVGADFAVMEAKLILAAVLRNFRADLVPAQEIEPEGTVTLYPKDGIEMNLVPRDAAP